jgi:uncharacterized Fe-S cluster-containing radical SAM superfamily protein
LFDPVKLALETEKIVADGMYRRYYRRVRPGGWYGGIASADCVGCCLRCVFCWSSAPRDHPNTFGKFYLAGHIFRMLDECAKKFRYQKLRVSGNEPTIGKNHLFRLLELAEQGKYFFILETNGILLGYDANYCRQLSTFKNLHVRVSLKGTNEEEFARLTGARPNAFKLQLKAVENLLNAGVSCHPAVMMSFTTQKQLEILKKRLFEISKDLPEQVEEEYVILYPPVEAKLREAGLKPITVAETGSNRKAT